MVDPVGAAGMASATMLAEVRTSDLDVTGGREDEDGPVVAPGAVIGRYIILSRIGSGGMGTVYAAHDPELDRKVAVKLMQPGAGWVDSVRMLREAQALARLAHPNVVAVFDVGPIADGVFIAMEFVEGVTLSAWLGQRRRSWREVLEVFKAAGQGLVAAHAADVVHRDFKPDNVMIGSDGRVRVMDFGLACAARGRAAELVETQPMKRERQPAMDMHVTRDGALLGTPSYMAPEQWHGVTPQARGDQFSFCVALWEALYGERPFQGPTIHALMLAVTTGELAGPRRGARKVPTWIREVLERGLARSPEHRFPSMEALLAALVRGQARVRMRRVLIGVGAVATAVAVVLGGRSHRISVCEAAGAEMTAVWNEEARGALREALVATGVPHATTAYEKVVPWIDGWTQAWSATRTQVCREAEVEGSRSPELYARAAACLDEQKAGLAGLLAVFGEGEATDVQRVVPAVAGLPPAGDCAERTLLAHRLAPPVDGEVRQQVEGLRRELMRIQGLLAAGRYRVGLARAETLVKEAEVLGYRPLEIEARSVLGHLAARSEQHERAEATWKRVYIDAGALGADDAAAQAAVQIVRTIGVGRSRSAEALEWATPAEMLVNRLGQAQGLLGASFLDSLAVVHNVRGAYEEALALHGRALAIREQVLGPQHPDVAVTLNNLANVQRARGAYDAALQSHERALTIREEALGADHPEVAATLNNLGLLHQTRGDYEAAAQLLARALAIREAALGPEHLDVATTRSNLGHLRQLRGDLDGAQAELTRALQVREAALGPEHPDVATTLNHLGVLQHARGDHEEAFAQLGRALALWEKALGKEHPKVATALVNLGNVHMSSGELAEARALHTRALAIREKALGPEHADVGRSLHHLAELHERAGEVAEAQALAERAQALSAAALGAEHPDSAAILVTLGLVHAARGEHVPAQATIERALAIAERAFGPQHPRTAAALASLADVLLTRGALEEAGLRFTRALMIWEAALGPGHRDVATALIGLARVAVARGRAGAAVPLYTRAIGLLDRPHTPAGSLAAARGELARASGARP